MPANHESSGRAPVKGQPDATPGSVPFLTFAFTNKTLEEIEAFAATERKLEGLVIDVRSIGFSLPIDMLIRFSQIADRILAPKGVLLLVKSEGALALVKGEPGLDFTFSAYANPLDILAKHPQLAEHVCTTIPGIDRRRLADSSSTLSNHILLTSVPVMTEQGRKARDSFMITPQNQWVLQNMDDYTTVDTLCRVMEESHGIPMDGCMRILQELEAEKLIFPLFSRISFLAKCYRNQQAFRLGRYMVAIGILTEWQLHELLEMQADQKRENRLYLGLLAVRAGYINNRELEMLMKDQYLYGGYTKVSEAAGSNQIMDSESMTDSIIGSLAAIDAPGLLQSVSTSKKTGLLSIENNDKCVLIVFNNGRPTHAKMNKLKGAHAVVELLSTWKEGIFLFRDQGTAQGLDEACELTRTLDKMMLDSALAEDQMKQLLGEFSNGHASVFERVQHFSAVWPGFSQSQLKYYDDTPVPDGEKQMLLDLAKASDGLSTLRETISKLDQWPSHLIVKGTHLLLQNKLIVIQQTSFFQPVNIFQGVINEMGKQISKQDNKKLLDLSLHYVHGDSPLAQEFQVDNDCRISVNLAQVKAMGIPISTLIGNLRRWHDAYLAYCRRLLGPSVVESLVQGQPRQNQP